MRKKLTQFFFLFAIISMIICTLEGSMVQAKKKKKKGDGGAFG